MTTAHETNRTTLELKNSRFFFSRKFIFQSPLVVFRNQGLPDQIGVSHKGEASFLNYFFTDNDSTKTESIILTPGGVMAVLFNIQEITGQVITESLELSFTKPKSSGQLPLQIGIINKPMDSFIGKFHTVPIAGK